MTCTLCNKQKEITVVNFPIRNYGDIDWPFDLKEKGQMAAGDYTNLEFGRTTDDRWLVFAEGDGVAAFEVFYCPLCGRKLFSDV